MTTRVRFALALAAFVHGLAACDSPRLPAQPSAVPQISVPPTPAVYSVTAGAQTVVAGADLTVTWNAAPSGMRDWIGIFRVGDEPCHHGWSSGTGGRTSGTLTLQAPLQVGEYEFRYHLNDSCNEVARSSPVTVVTAGR